jgi:hypothetical protein
MNNLLQCTCSTYNTNIVDINESNSVAKFDITGLIGLSFKQYMAVRLSYCSIPNVFFTFNNYNNKLDVQVEGLGRAVLTFDEGIYDTAETLVSVVELAFQDAFPDANFVAFLDPILGKMIISSTITWAILKEQTTCYAVLGLLDDSNLYPLYAEPFVDTQMNPVTTFYLVTSKSFCTLQSVKRVDVFIDELRTKSFIESKSVGILASITIDSAPEFGNIQYTNPSDDFIGFSHLKNIETLTFQFRDEVGNLVDFTNMNWKVILDIQFLERPQEEKIGFYDFIDVLPIS